MGWRRDEKALGVKLPVHMGCSIPLIVPLLQTQEKERINEANISQLQSAVDRMLKESRERLKTYSNERKQLVDEKVIFFLYLLTCRRNSVRS